MMQRFDIVIATYKRPRMLQSLVSKINQCEITFLDRIIIIDSSDQDNIDIQKLDRVLYLKSSHKNQPYQRYLGYKASNADIVIFFDDDVQILNTNLFNFILESFNDKMIVGATVRFTDDGENAVNRAMGVTTKISNKSIITKFLWTLTGAPKIKNNHIWLAGLKGDYDYSLGFTEAIGGPGTLSFRRSIIDSLFDDTLFSLYERKLGKGEDKYISMGALEFGKIALINTVCLLHPSHESSYFNDVTSFARREIYARLWLSKRYASVKKIPAFWVYLHYYWYALWRIVISGIHATIQPKKFNFNRFKGRCLGVWDTFFIPMKSKILCPDINWENDLKKDLINSKK